MNLTVNGKKIHFADDQFLCKGGEGKIYVKNGIAYKIFHSPSLSSAMPVASEMTSGILFM